MYVIFEFKICCSEVYKKLEFKICCPSSVVSVVVVLCPSVRPVRPSVVVPYLQIQGRMQIFKKQRRNRGRECEIRIELEIWKSIAGGKLLCVLKTCVLWTKHFCFRIVVPMSILTFWILLYFLLFFVVVRRVRRRRHPSVLRPVRPSPSSVVVVLCPSVRRRPSSSTCKSKAACKFSKK